MLPGVTGSLIAGAFLEEVLIPELRSSDRAPTRRTLSALNQWWRRVDKMLGPASSARAVLDIAALPLAVLLGYAPDTLEPLGAGFVGALTNDHGTAAVFRTTTWSADAGAAWRDAVRAARTAGTRWGLVYTGRKIRIVDASRTWSRRAMEFDIPIALADERSAVALWTLCGCPALSATDDRLSLAATVDRSDKHALAVCTSLGDGVLSAVAGLVTALDGTTGTSQAGRKGRRSNTTDGATRTGANPRAVGLDRDTFEQAVTIVYRLLFLLFAEARALVPIWHQVYRDAYTIQALCKRTIERPQSPGLWSAFQAISRLAHAGCHAGDLVVTPFNGRLFSPHHTPMAERAIVSDAVVGQTVISLATGAGAGGRRLISYADLDVEQLGAVYERVLEFEPARAHRHAALTLARTSDERKATGSFYTPRAMTEFLVRRALHPLVAGRSADEILGLRVMDPAMGSGAFLVAACRYLATAAELALRAQGHWVGEDNLRARRAELRRLVAQRSVYGVDLNPVAVQLARLSLWLTTLTGDRPLTFLDHHLAVGDSLVGASLQDLARPPEGWHRQWDHHGRRLPLFGDHTAPEMAALVLPDRFRLAIDPGDTPAAVRHKEQQLAALVAPGAPLARWKSAADMWCARWFGAEVTPGVYFDVLSSLLSRTAALSEHQRAAVVERASVIGRAQRFFHWDLEFPEVFFDPGGRRKADGGFDAVIGNPPWDVLRADTGDEVSRDRDRGNRRTQLRFFRDAGIYTCQGRGHLNRYQLFVERTMQLVRQGGRIGLVLPSGLATDQGSGPLRRALVDSVAIDRVLGFENRSGIFPIHRDVKFLLVTGTKGGRTERLVCSFGRSQPNWLEDLPDAAADDPPEARSISLSRSLLESWDPDHLRFPMLPTSLDLELLSHVSALVPRLGNPEAWNARFGRELNATDDRPHFVALPPDAPSPGTPLLPVIEGKHLEPFRARPELSTTGIPASAAAGLLDPVRTFGRRRLGYRDVASATNRLTLIAALLPAGTVTTHTVFCLKTPMGEASQYCLLALLNSLVANYLVRLQVTTHVTAAVMARLPVPRPRGDSVAFRELAALARSLEKSGMEDIDAYARLNAIVARLYQLTARQYEHVVGTFPLLTQQIRRACINAYHTATETQRHREQIK